MEDRLIKKLKRDYLEVVYSSRIEAYLVEKVERILPVCFKLKDGGSYERKYMSFSALSIEGQGYTVYGNGRKIWSVTEGLNIEKTN